MRAVQTPMTSDLHLARMARGIRTRQQPGWTNNEPYNPSMDLWASFTIWRLR